MRRIPLELQFIAVLDALIGLSYLLLEPSFFTGRGLRIPRAWLPLHVWALLYLAVAVGMLASSRTRGGAAVLGVMVNAAFGFGLLAAFITGAHTAHQQSSPVGGLLLVGWGARHYLTGRTA